MKAWMRAMSWSRSGSGPGSAGASAERTAGTTAAPMVRRHPAADAGRRHLPPEPPPGDPHGLGPPLLDDMRTVPVRSRPRSRRWRMRRHAPYPADRRHHGGLLIDRRQKVCKQMATQPGA